MTFNKDKHVRNIPLKPEKKSFKKRLRDLIIADDEELCDFYDEYKYDSDKECGFDPFQFDDITDHSHSRRNVYVGMKGPNHHHMAPPHHMVPPHHMNHHRPHHDHGPHHMLTPPHLRHKKIDFKIDNENWPVLMEVFDDEDCAMSAALLISDAPDEIQVLAEQIIRMIAEV